MEQKTSSEYDRVAYPGYTHPQTHPDRLFVLGRLFGLSPAPVTACRVLEFGCGDGSNLIPMAYTLPRSQFTGVDLALAPIQRGMQLARDLGLTNLRLVHADLSDAGGSADPGGSAGTTVGAFVPFDYVIAHGVYSWVPQEVRLQLLRNCRKLLAPHGIAFISYNTFPGFHLRNMLREMLRFHAREVTDPEQRVRLALDFVRFLSSPGSASDAASLRKTQDQYRAWLKEECERVETYAPGHLYHDDLAATNDAFYFTEFIEAARREGLQFLAEADFFEMSDETLSDSAREALRKFAPGPDRVLREQYLDFLKCRRFRQTLLCRSEAALVAEPQVEKVKNFRILSPAACDTGAPNLQPGVHCRFETPKGAKCQTDLPLGKAALTLLGNAWPASVPFEQLLEAVSQYLGAQRVAADPPEVSREVLAGFLLRLYQGGLVDFRGCEPPATQEVSAKPLVYPLARWQAARGEFVTSLFHTQIRIEDEIGRTILTWLDGTVDQAQLRERLWEFLKARKMIAPAQADEAKLRQEVESKLAVKLEQLARLGLLVLRPEGVGI